MRISSDWHIHSRNSCDEAALTVADLIVGARQCGIRDFGLTDHLHTPYNLPDIGASRRHNGSAEGSLRGTVQRLSYTVELFPAETRSYVQIEE